MTDYLSIFGVLCMVLAALVLCSPNMTPRRYVVGTLLVWAGLSMMVYAATTVVVPS